MTRPAKRLVAAVVFLTACGTGPGNDEGTHFVEGEGGIREIRHRGTVLTEGTGGYYVIGGCDDRDAHDANVTTLQSNGAVMNAGNPACPGAPFTITVTPINSQAVRTEITVGPLPVDYATLSVPLDMRAHLVDFFRTDVDPLFIGGCGEVERRSTREGGFDTVPTPCPPGQRVVGLAETRRPATLAVLGGPKARVVRRILSGDHVVSIRFFRNLPIDVENSEVAFGPRRAGDVIHLVEEISVE